MTDARAVKDAIRDLLPTFRERADEAERLRVVPEASIKELEETGFFRLLQPQRFDGLEADPIDFYTAVRDIAGACGSTGWVSSVVGVHPWQVALFADEAQQAVWGEDTNTRLSSSYAPTGKAVADRGRLHAVRASGASPPAATTATWVLLGGLVFNDEGQVVDFKTFMVPRENYDDHRRLAHGRPARHRLQRHRGRGRRSSPRRSRSRWATPAAASARARSRTPPTSTSCRSTRSSPAPSPRRSSAWRWAPTTSTSRCSRSASARRTSARRRRSTRSPPSASPRASARSTRPGRCWSTTSARSRRYVAKGEKIPLELRLKVRRDQVLGTQRAIDAIDSLFEASGGRALAKGTYLQRAWRDAHAGRVHAANDPERALQMYGAHEFGHKIDPGMY